MSWLFEHQWLTALFAFLLGALITWLLILKRVPVRKVVTTRENVFAGVAETSTEWGATTTPTPTTPTVKAPTQPDYPTVQARPVVAEPEVVPEPTVVAKPVVAAAAPASVPDGPYGKGSAEPLAGGAAPSPLFTIKGNANSGLFHTVESPYYGRTIAEVWFNSEKAATKAGFKKYK